MKFYTNPASPFSRKCQIIAKTLNVAMEDIHTMPLTDETLRVVNPLAQIPALVLDDGSAMHDSRVICEYLDHIGGNQFFPRESRRWPALTLQSLADGIASAAVAYALLGRETPPPAATRERHQSAILRGLDALEKAELSDTPLIGEVAVVCAIGYIELRQPDLDWKATRPKLAAWYAKISALPAIAATAPSSPSKPKP